MRFAIFSDLHDLTEGLRQVLRDAQQRQADHLIYLGDVGHDARLFQTLQSESIACTFGNWEVSGHRRLPGELASWVAQWPGTLRHDDVLFCHATPDMPVTVTTTADAAQAMCGGLGWNQLFPQLNINEEARWQALAALEMHGLQAAFHGHTHVQQAWRYGSHGGRRRWQKLDVSNEFSLNVSETDGEPEQHDPARYLIGVGSAGAPQDGPALRYALYDSRTHVVTLVRLGPGA